MTPPNQLLSCDLHQLKIELRVKTRTNLILIVVSNGVNKWINSQMQKQNWLPQHNQFCNY